MALGKMMGLEGNPLYSAFDSRRNALMGIGAGLLSGNWGNMGRYAMEGRQMDDAYATQQEETATRQEQMNQTVQAMLAAGREDLANMAEAGQMDLAWKTFVTDQSQSAVKPTAEIQNFEYGQKNPDFLEWQTQKGGPAEMSLQPTWLQDEQGGWHFGQATKDGRIIESQLPPGMSAVPPADVAGAKAGATVDAKKAAEARAMLPGAQQQVQVTLNAIDKVAGPEAEAGLNEWFGQFGPRGVYVHPGSQMGNWSANFEQAKGQSFLQARQFLKGQGAITELESAKAESAYSNMEAAARTGDKQTFLQAAAEFRQAVEQGYAKLAALAAGDYAAGAPQGGGQPAGDIDSILSGYGL